MSSSSHGMPFPSLCDYLNVLGGPAGLLQRFRDGPSSIRFRFSHRNPHLSDGIAQAIQDHLDGRPGSIDGRRASSTAEEFTIGADADHKIDVALQWIDNFNAVVTTAIGAPGKAFSNLSIHTDGTKTLLPQPGQKSALLATGVTTQPAQKSPTSPAIGASNGPSHVSQQPITLANESPMMFFDWSTTPLGLMETWDPALRVTMDLVNAMPYPAVVLWGPEHYLIYNRLYSEIHVTGRGRREVLLGQPFQYAWPDVWESTKPAIDAVMGGRTLYLENQRLNLIKMGVMREYFFTYSMVPIRQRDGTICGVVAPSFDATRLVLSERRVTSLHDLLVAIGTCATPGEACQAAARSLAGSSADICALSIYSVQTDKRGGNTTPSLTPEPWRLKLEARSGEHEAALGEQDLWIPHFSDRSGEKDRRYLGNLRYRLSRALATNIAVHLDVVPEGDWARPMVIVRECPIYDDVMASDYAPQNQVPVNTSISECCMLMVITLNTLLEYNHLYADFVNSISDILSSRVSALVAMQHQIQTANDALEAEASKNLELKRAIEATSSELRKYELKFMAAFEASPAGLWMLSDKGEILYTNTAHNALFGPLDGAPPEQWMEIVHPDDRETTISTIMRAAKEQSTSQARIYRHGADKTSLLEKDFFWVEYRGGPTFDENGQYLFSTGSTIDITNKKEYENALLKQATDAKELQRKQEAFMDMISHELRNPLGGISLAVDSIIGRLQDLSLEHNARISDIMHDISCLQVSLGMMRRLIDDVLSLSKLESELLSITPQHCFPVHQIREVLRLFRPELELEEISSSVEESLGFLPYKSQLMFFDGARVQQILINLISNAIKFSRNTGESHISVAINATTEQPWQPASASCPRIEDPSNDHDQHRRIFLTFSVSDTGVGLKPDQIERLFKRFSQLAPTFSIKVGGTGLGLFICKRLAWLLGGDIRARAQSKGSVFEFFVETYVLLKNPTSTNGDSDLAGHGLYRSLAATPTGLVQGIKHILVVEDNKVNQQLEKRQLLRAGYEVATADDGVQAMEYIVRTVQSGSPLDCILMDIEMPNKTGLQCAVEIRDMQRAGLISRPLILLGVSANVRDGQVKQILDAGMDGFIGKPFQITDIIEKMNEVVAVKTAESQMTVA